MPSTQLNLFRGAAPISRRHDPESSHLAAHALETSGRRDSQKQEVLGFLRNKAYLRFAGRFTATEIAAYAWLDRYVVSRRLPDLEADGLVERGPIRACAVTGHKCLTWRAL